MSEKRRQNNTLKTKFLKNVMVTYIDGVTESFEAIQVIEQGVVIGRLYSENNGVEEFVKYGFISRSCIKQITESLCKNVSLKKH